MDMKAYEKLRQAIKAIRLVDAQEWSGDLPRVQQKQLTNAIQDLAIVKVKLMDIEQSFRQLDSWMNTDIKL
jgi:hypothetical protein